MSTHLFDDRYLSTVGIKVNRKTVMVPPRGWRGRDDHDAVGYSRQRRITSCAGQLSAPGTAGAILVCDLARPSTLDGLRSYLRDLNPSARMPASCWPNAQRDLLDQRQLAAAQIKPLPPSITFSGYLTSARNGDEVETVFRHWGRPAGIGSTKMTNDDLNMTVTSGALVVSRAPLGVCHHKRSTAGAADRQRCGAVRMRRQERRGRIHLRPGAELIGSERGRWPLL
ncbi:hypothetical protein [Candidatus Amarolinea dominans]|uniref:hypothetical protein n=1 Tax=Candidatus Amarolinea dominans TaxID=3140696 RepID=UPI003134C7B5|nr:hypothetical protein [Anaerolineae bacterium]